MGIYPIHTIQLKMILKIKNVKTEGLSKQRFGSKSLIKNMENLEGFVHKKTIKKYIDRNKRLTQRLTEKLIEDKHKVYKFDLNKFLIVIILFCGSLFTYHMYTLWKKYKNENEDESKNESKNEIGKINIVPLAGIY